MVTKKMLYLKTFKRNFWLSFYLHGHWTFNCSPIQLAIIGVACCYQKWFNLLCHVQITDIHPWKSGKYCGIIARNYNVWWINGIWRDECSSKWPGDTKMIPYHLFYNSSENHAALRIAVCVVKNCHGFDYIFNSTHFSF